MAGQWTDILGTLRNGLRLGLQGVFLKDATGNLRLRTNDDSADAELAALKVVVSGDDIVLGEGAEQLVLSRNGAQADELQIIFPAIKATDGQVLAQKSGTAADVIELEWVTAGGTASAEKVDTTSLAFGSGSTVNLFNTGASDVINSVEVIIDTPFDGTPSLSIGIAGQTSKYMAATDVDLKDTARTSFVVHPNLPAQGVESLIATYSAGGATAGAARIHVRFCEPQ